ncbi:MAG TPA: MFS transporter [Steroidobacteraceae bacterium]|nr:MFS transporter [Steroidobacteraceae bacterium]
MSAPAAVTDHAPLTRRTALAGLCVLTLVNLLNYLDRYVISAVLPDLKAAHLGLSDFRLGTLMTGFLLVYMLAAPVFGALGDRRSRTRSIAVGVFVWSIATALSGFARNYLQLLAARATVGVGEAAYGTIAPTLLADYFPVTVRGRVFAVFGMAIPVGAALGYIVGGLVDHWYGWRAAFFVAGVPGMLLAVAVLALPDPPRGLQERQARAGESPVNAPQARGTLAIYRGLLSHAPYVLTVLGYAAYTFALGGLAFWMPTFLERARGVAPAQATSAFGAIVVVTGLVGTFAGGWLGDYWLRFSREAYLWMSGLVTLLAVPVAVVALAARAPSLYYPAIVTAELLLFMSTGPINSAIVNLVAPAERASAIALSVFAIHLLGDVISPPIIGALSDLGSLQQAVMIVPAAAALCALLWMAAARASAKARLHS